MARTRVVYYQESDGVVPVIEWFLKLPGKARAKCLVYLGRLEKEGHRLRRPIGDYLRDGVYELRPSFSGVHYRILYFFHDNDAVVVSHGLTKEREVPMAEIERAVRRRKRFLSDPKRHSFDPAKGEQNSGGETKV